MLTLCDNCKQHYDDRAQSKKCNGFSGHELVGMSAIAEHRMNVANGTARTPLVTARERTLPAPETDEQP